MWLAHLLPPGLQEVANTEKLGSRGEVWVVAQLVLMGLVVFPPGPLEVQQHLCRIVV